MPPIDLDRAPTDFGLNVARNHGRTKSSEMVGLTDFDLYPRGMAQAFFDREQEIMTPGEPMVDFEEPFVIEDGRERWFLTSKVPLRNRHGDLIGLAGVTRDVTEKKRLVRETLDSKNVLSQAMAEMSDGLAMFNPEGRLVFCNDQYRAAFPRSALCQTARRQHFGYRAGRGAECRKDRCQCRR
ncbi:PAS domain-containing protein [Ensifer adhaerens]|uniref:PAS domain-containing protein n=1 Tax=Ensifer adhaerens TaxID=106592 RepID=UPI001F29702F|nr:PAS domain-containing protein [Ensifer adhaerens]